jgi:nucleoid-associated protein YgaU
MTTGEFSPTERKQLVNAPQLIRHLLTVADRGGIFTKRSEVKALREFLGKYESQSALVQSIIAGQPDADQKVEANAEEVQRMLEQVGALLEAKTDEAEGDAVRDFLMSAGEAVAKATREQSWLSGSGASPAEEKALAAIAGALKATEADKRRRHTAAMNAEALQRVEEQRPKAKAEAEAQKQAAEAQKRAEEARRAAEEQARWEREAQQQASAAQAKAEAQQQVAEAKTEAQQQAAEARQEGEVEIYVVKPGDTLSGIAKSLYGKAGRWHEIFEANRDIIKKPNLIRPGWKLRIPR